MSDNDDLIHTSNNSYNTSYQLNNSFDKLQYKVYNHSFSPQLSLKTRIPINPFLKERIVNEIIQEAKQREFDIKQLYSEMFEMRKQANIQLSDEEKIKRLNERDQAIIDVREQRKQKLQQIQFQKQLEQLEKEKVEQLMYDRANKRQQEIKQEQKRVKELQIQQIQQQQTALEQAELQNKQKYESKIVQFNQLRREALLQQELLRKQEAVSEEERKKQMYEENLIIPPPPIAQLESVPEFESVREKMKAWIGKLHGMFEAFSRQQLQLCNSRMQSIDLVLRLLVKMKQLVLLTACVGDVLYFDRKFAYLVDCQYLMVEQQTDQQILKRVRQQYKEECGQRLKELKQQFKQNSKNEQALPAIQKAIAVNQALQMEMRNVKDVLQLEMIVSKYKPQLK
ncbi:Hypothetical_protein [Hexamita inflata]|uniref:Hypothetical_protein n=1 Tax=Hexamita inflata TaxID=28002 RepID=A0AA86NMT2_9EUKA|nr:Hypothetical protein HINF_LOCUS9476 [Hexamita inflata]